MSDVKRGVRAALESHAVRRNMIRFLDGGLHYATIDDNHVVYDDQGNRRRPHEHLQCSLMSDPHKGHDHECELDFEYCDDDWCFGTYVADDISGAKHE